MQRPGDAGARLRACSVCRGLRRAPRPAGSPGRLRGSRATPLPARRPVTRRPAVRRGTRERPLPRPHHPAGEGVRPQACGETGSDVPQRRAMLDPGRTGTRPIRWCEVADHDWSDFGLVLGAGGSTGLAFEAGVLLALSVDHHISLANASRLVGTSAGSITSTLITLGFERRRSRRARRRGPASHVRARAGLRARDRSTTPRRRCRTRCG